MPASTRATAPARIRTIASTRTVRRDQGERRRVKLGPRRVIGVKGISDIVVLAYAELSSQSRLRTAERARPRVGQWPTDRDLIVILATAAKRRRSDCQSKHDGGRGAAQREHPQQGS